MAVATGIYSTRGTRKHTSTMMLFRYGVKKNIINVRLWCVVPMCVCVQNNNNIFRAGQCHRRRPLRRQWRRATRGPKGWKDGGGGRG